MQYHIMQYNNNNIHLHALSHYYLIYLKVSLLNHKIQVSTKVLEWDIFFYTEYRIWYINNRVGHKGSYLVSFNMLNVNLDFRL